MDLKYKKILVTGAGGFIGSHLTERLLSLGSEVTCFVRYNSLNRWGFLDTIKDKNLLRVIAADLKDFDAVRKAVKGQDAKDLADIFYCLSGQVTFDTTLANKLMPGARSRVIGEALYKMAEHFDRLAKNKIPYSVNWNGIHEMAEEESKV